MNAIHARLIPTGGWWQPTAKIFLLGALACITLSGCIPLTLEDDDDDAHLNLQPVQYASLKGWQTDNHAEALQVFLASCTKITTLPPEKKILNGGSAGEWIKACQEAEALPDKSAEPARLFFENHFRPFLVSGKWKSTGLFTGYYEPAIQASLDASTDYPAPIYGTPSDLLTLNLQDFDQSLPKRTLVGRVQDGKFVPYPDRAMIDGGALADKPIAWGKDPVDVFFVQIQGSGKLVLPDGREQMIGYASQNGHPYTAIGKKLIESGDLTKETANADSIKQWLRNNPAKADAMMEQNKSYVFFRMLDGGVIGAEGVPLTPERSLAIDKRFIPFGAPIWLETATPAIPGQATQQYNRLMIAQDTGGAIKGKVRGDIFFGSGSRAADLAGNMKQQGQYYLLLPVVTPAS